MRRFLEPLLWAGCLALCSCAALREPIVDPQTGQPVMRPDGTPQTVYDETVESGAGLVSILTGNALLGPALIGMGAAARGSVLGTKKS